MAELVPVLTEGEIEKRVSSLAARINADFAGQPLVLVGVLKGSFIFLAVFARRINLDTEIDFVRVSSYGKGSKSSGKIRLVKDVETDLKNKAVLIVEDIVDSGLTLFYLKEHLQSLGPRSVHICAFIDKVERREQSVVMTMSATGLRKGSLVGYGLDHGEKHRSLPGIYAIKP